MCSSHFEAWVGEVCLNFPAGNPMSRNIRQAQMERTSLCYLSPFIVPRLQHFVLCLCVSLEFCFASDCFVTLQHFLTAFKQFLPVFLSFFFGLSLCYVSCLLKACPLFFQPRLQCPAFGLWLSCFMTCSEKKVIQIHHPRTMDVYEILMAIRLAQSDELTNTCHH